MDKFTKIGPIDEVTRTRPKRVTSGLTEVVVFNIDGQIHAVENNCPHQHFSRLHEGTLDGCTLTCPMHGWSFDLRTGKPVNGAGTLKTYEVRIRDGVVWVELPEADRAFPMFP
ncbi:MAG: non-heme iron oxygenase ferredoxin subunit [Bacteroidota bacterium]